jgi:hypothetical protein
MTAPAHVHTGASQIQRSQSRRQPAHLSVSLLHSLTGAKAQPSTHDSESSPDDLSTRAAALSDSPSSLQPLHGKPSSGGSSNAEGWFDTSNAQRRANNASYTDSDPPFFMRNSSSYDSPPDGHGQQARNGQMNVDLDRSLALRPGLIHAETDGSSTEEYRGVIDDLTIENKKLKRKLKKYEKMHDAHLKDDKLFEIRVHGLPVDKKRELEDMLRNFASNITTRGGGEFPVNGYEGITQVKGAESSMTSLLQNDSAYASMSASGRGSSAQSGSGSKHGKITPTARFTKQRNVHSYLHHIPENLMPQQNPESMSEQTRKKLVVGRLEQIFAGRGAATGPHHQALQQEQVSQMAAHADRAYGQPTRKEGVREAAIMLKETEEPMDSTAANPARLDMDTSNATNHMEHEYVDEQDFANKSPDYVQRPTRPIDLDLDRAQVPADNMRYIRHLGFSPLDIGSTEVPEDGHGWIYLNVLINMAQLHTLHVTADFVTKAVTECSERFEVSTDGRKVRWKGITRNIRLAPIEAEDDDDESNADMSPRKRMKRTHTANARHKLQTESSGHGAVAAKANKLVYTPLFHHRSSMEDSEDSSSDDYDDSGSSVMARPVGNESSAMTSSGIRTAMAPAKKQKKRTDGPIIFYNNAGFCTDLSSDRDGPNPRNRPVYRTANVLPIGRPYHVAKGKTLELRGPLDEAGTLPEAMSLGDNPIATDMELTFPPPSPPKAYKSRHLHQSEFEVTGMGGVYPADHFAVSVESRRAVVDHIPVQRATHDSTTKAAPHKLAAILRAGRSKTAASSGPGIQITKRKYTEHPPSRLPPASCFMPSGEDSTSESDSEIDDAENNDADSPDALPPSAAPQAMGHFDARSEDSDVDMEDDEDDDDDDDESDGSLDLLAAVRELDPETVRQQEREYDMNMADRLAEAIPAGSSAATAGGGSGFASPAMKMGEKQYQQAVRDARKVGH